MAARRDQLKGRWFRSPSGTAAQVTGTVERSRSGERLYRLRFLCGARGETRFTEAEIRGLARRWLRRRPRR